MCVGVVLSRSPTRGFANRHSSGVRRLVNSFVVCVVTCIRTSYDSVASSDLSLLRRTTHDETTRRRDDFSSDEPPLSPTSGSDFQCSLDETGAVLFVALVESRLITARNARRTNWQRVNISPLLSSRSFCSGANSKQGGKNDCRRAGARRGEAPPRP
jgi:hypothetical protein